MQGLSSSRFFNGCMKMIRYVRYFMVMPKQHLFPSSTGGHERFEDALLYADGSVDSFVFSDGILALCRHNDDFTQISADIRLEGEYGMQRDVIATADGGYLIVSIV